MAKIKNGSYGVGVVTKEFLTIIKKEYPREAQKLLFIMANRTLARVKKKTPVDSGQARRSWQVGDTFKKGDEYFIEVFSDIAVLDGYDKSYVELLEFGYQQSRGNFIPKFGKSSTGKFIKGKFMLTLSLKELGNEMPILVKKFYNELLKELKL